MMEEKHNHASSDVESEDNAFMDFEVEKTHQSFFEAGKLHGTAFLTYLLLLCLTGLLAFGSSAIQEESPKASPQIGGPSKESPQLKVPFLELAIAQPYAAWIVLTLSCGALYWFFSSGAYELLLAAKLYDLLDKRYKTGWYTNLHLRYPSVFSSAGVIAQYSVWPMNYLFSISSTVIIFIVTFVLHFVLTLEIVKNLPFTSVLGSGWRIVLYAVNMFLLAPAVIAFGVILSMRRKSNKALIDQMVLPKPKNWGSSQ